MGRLSAAHATAMGAGDVRIGLFAEFDFKSGVTRFWSGESDISWNGYTWQAGAIIGTVQMSGEGDDMEARQCVFTLNGVDRSYYATAINTNYRGRPVRLWFNLLNATSDAVTYSYELEEARMDTLTVTEQEDSLTLTLTAESYLLDLFRPRRHNMTSPDHNREYPGDKFYEYVPYLANMELPWGLESAGSSAGGGGPGGGPPGGIEQQWGPQ